MSILIITSHIKKPEAAPITAKSNAENLKDSFQSIGCTRITRRFLFESSGLVCSKRTRCRTWELCVSVVGMYESSKFILSALSFHLNDVPE